MRKVALYIAMSLDGYIADKQGGVDWLGGDGSEPEYVGSYPEFIETVDTILLGYKTYHQLITELSPGNWVYGGKRTYVMTHQKLESSEEIIFTDKSLADLISELKKESGKVIWVCGGATVVNQMISLKLIDHFCVTVIPTILGGGVKLFSPYDDVTDLKLISTRSYNGMTDLVYERRG